MVKIKLGAVVLDSNNSEKLADFYQNLLGWTTRNNLNEFIYLSSNAEGIRLVFQENANYEKPTWPVEQGQQQQMVHLDFYVEDLEEAVNHAIACGAKQAKIQYSDFWKVMIDPAGHPFCILQIPSETSHS